VSDLSSRSKEKVVVVVAAAHQSTLSLLKLFQRESLNFVSILPPSQKKGGGENQLYHQTRHFHSFASYFFVILLFWFVLFWLNKVYVYELYQQTTRV
jgi:hypothetical protein